MENFRKGLDGGVKEWHKERVDTADYHQIAARTADRMCGRAAARVTREERADAHADAQIQQAQVEGEAATIEAGIAASEADPSFAALRGMDVLAGLPEITPDSEFADDAADGAWLYQRRASWTLHAIARRRLLRLADTLRVADAAALPELLPAHQRDAVLRNTLARFARDALSALAHARLRVAHICITARILRAGRASAATSAAHARTCC